MYFGLVWLWFLLPLFIGFIVSFLFPAFIYFRFLYVVPAFYLLVGWGISNLKSKTLRRNILLVLVALNLFSWFVYIVDKGQQREDWKTAVAYIESSIKPNDVVIFEFPDPFAPYIWYSKNLSNAYGVTDSISANPTKTRQITKDVLTNISGIYYFEYLRDLSDPLRVVEKEIIKQGFSLKKVSNYVGVGQVFYWTR